MGIWARAMGDFFRSLAQKRDTPLASPRNDNELLPQSSRLTVFDPFKIFCDGPLCRYRDAQDLYFFDAGHLSQHGVDEVLANIAF